MADTAPSAKLTFEGAQKLLAAAIAKAKEMKVPQCICIVDSGGHLLTMARMDGAFALSVDTALRKAQTAAAYGIPTGDIAAGARHQARHRDRGKARQSAGRPAGDRRRPCHRRDRRRLRHRRAGPRGGGGRARRDRGREAVHVLAVRRLFRRRVGGADLFQDVRLDRGDVGDELLQLFAGERDRR